MAVNASRISPVLRDASGVTASMPFYLTIDVGQSLSQIITEAQTLVTLINALTDAQIVTVGCGAYVPLLGGWNSAPIGACRCSNVAVFSFGCVTGSCIWPIPMPAIKASKTIAGFLNLADSDVQAFYNHVKANTGSYRYTTNGGVQLNSLAWTFLGRRGYRAQTSRNTWTVGT